MHKLTTNGVSWTFHQPKPYIWIYFDHQIAGFSKSHRAIGERILFLGLRRLSSPKILWAVSSCWLQLMLLRDILTCAFVHQHMKSVVRWTPRWVVLEPRSWVVCKVMLRQINWCLEATKWKINLQKFGFRIWAAWALTCSFWGWLCLKWKMKCPQKPVFRSFSMVLLCMTCQCSP